MTIQSHKECSYTQKLINIDDYLHKVAGPHLGYKSPSVLTIQNLVRSYNAYWIPDSSAIWPDIQHIPINQNPLDLLSALIGRFGKCHVFNS